uniref:RRM domain-containing protein n=1 Tax=Romanomermis culicivorax TaxID=13658 RepID=A0A915KIU6_ROMCU
EESKDESQKQVELQKIIESSSFKAKKVLKQKETAVSSYNWNTLFLGQNAVADALAERLGTEKSELLDAKLKTSLGVRMALGETQLVKETREFLQRNGVDLDCFSDEKRRKLARSSTVILTKNLPANTSIDELRELFGSHGDLGRVVLPPSGISALVEFMNEQEAKKAFKALAYKRFKKSTPLFLEWAPMEVFSLRIKTQHTASTTVEDVATTSEMKTEENMTENYLGEQNEEESATLFVKNLNFHTTDDQLRQHFSKIGPIKSASIAKKKTPSSNSSTFLSMGYGFVEFCRKSDAMQALKVMQRKPLDDFALELKLSDKHSTPTIESEFNSKKRQREEKIGGK